MFYAASSVYTGKFGNPVAYGGELGVPQAI